MAALGTAVLLPPPSDALVTTAYSVSATPSNAYGNAVLVGGEPQPPPDPPFTGIPTTGQIWPRSRTTIVGDTVDESLYQLKIR